jgi:AraC-like DNA-binding protein
MPKQTVAASVARALMEFAASRGANRTALSERSLIDPADLQNDDDRIPLERHVALMKAGIELCNDPALALHFGESIDMTELALSSTIGAFSQTIAEGFAQLNRYARLSVEVDGAESGDRFVLTHNAGNLWLVDTRTNPNDFPELTESTFARMVCSYRRSLGEHQIVKAVHVTHAEPSHRAEYDRIFRTPVFFGSDKNALLLAEAAMPQRPPFSSSPVHSILTAHAELLLAKLESSKTARGRVEGLLAPILHTGDLSVDAIARKLGLSRQTLFRQLKAEGVTFEQVLDELRFKTALRYLNGEKVSIARTARLAGFSEPSAFSRAFKRWTGLSPRSYLARGDS